MMNDWPVSQYDSVAKSCGIGYVRSTNPTTGNLVPVLKDPNILGMYERIVK